MRNPAQILPAALTAVALAGPVHAQMADWQTGLTVYAWLPGLSTSIGTDFGTVDADNSSSEVLDALDMAFMATADASNGRWSVIADLLYTKLSDEEDTPFGLAFNDAEIEAKIGALSGYVGYRVAEGANYGIDLLGGFRLFDATITTSLGSGRIPGISDTMSKTWVDPLIGARGNVSFNDRWSATGGFDLGGTDTESDFTWQALATLNYAFSDKWTARAGWRYMQIRNVIDDRDVTIGLNGPVIGVAYRF